jgi:hypothetical protein
MRSHRVKIKRQRDKLLTYQITVIVDITICKTTLVREAEHKLAKAYVIPPKTEMAVLVKAGREGLSLLKPLYVK